MPAYAGAVAPAMAAQAQAMQAVPGQAVPAYAGAAAPAMAAQAQAEASADAVADWAGVWCMLGCCCCSTQSFDSILIIE